MDGAIRGQNKGRACVLGWCQEPARGLGLCGTHYSRFCYGRDMSAPVRRKSTCKADDCDRPSHSKWYCGTHYSRFKNGRDIEAPIVPREKSKGKTCRWDDCDLPVTNKGWCNAHYLRHMRGQPMDPPIRRTRREIGPCSWPGCEQSIRTASLCALHYGRKLNGSDMDAPVTTRSQPKSREGLDRITNRYGYVEVRRQGHFGRAHSGGKTWFQEHRYVMEVYLGRALHKGENVHHINGDKTDNRLENLELWLVHQPPGQRVKDLLNRAYALRERYKEDRDKLLNQQIPMLTEDNW